MEWLINRRRMMFNKVIPPDYLTFEDAEFWRICCEHWGDYNETVITDNGDNTVNIVTTFNSMSGDTLKKSNIIDSRQNVDNSQGTYVAGTTKEAVGITQNQCGMVTWIGRSGNNDSHNYFKYNTSILSLNDLQYFVNLTQLRGNSGRGGDYSAFNGCSNCSSIILPQSLTYLGDNAFRDCTLIFELDLSNITYLGSYGLRSTRISSFVPSEAFTSMSTYSLYQCVNLEYIDLPATTTDISAHAIQITKDGGTLVCRATTPPTLGTANFDRISKIYVPEDSLADYQAASNWSAHSSKMQAIEGTWYETHRSLEPTT